METIVTKRSSQIDDTLLLTGQTLSQISDRMVQLGLIWFITSSFGEGFLIWYLVVSGLPHALLVKYSGTAIDHLSALRTVLYSDFARGLVYLVSFFLLTLFPEWLNISNRTPVLWLLFVSVFISNIFSAFFNPAIMSLSVEIKENDQIQKLTAKLSAITSIATIIGPIVGLFVFNQFGLGGLFIISSLSYFISTYAVSLVTKSRALVTPANDAIASTHNNVFKTHKIIGIMLLVFFLMNLLLSPLQVLMPAMAKNLFGNSFNSLAILETILGLGILIGGTVLAVYSVNRRPLLWTWVFLVLISLSFQIFSLAGELGENIISIFGVTQKISFIASSTALLALGFSLGVANVLIINILQTRPEPHSVPRIMSLVNLISTATLPFSLALLGILQQSVSIVSLGQWAGGLLVIVAVFSYIPFRRFGWEIFK